MRTSRITYNVHDRGRQHRGVDRLFDTAALAALINGPEVQERVKHGDMQGYYGHWPRVKFGMATQEGGILDGKVISLPLAVRCTYLQCDAQGNVTHEHEFLDTAEGRLAHRLYESKSGGFSSAIDAIPRSRPSIPTDFYGFDYVFEPNYTTNRGHKAVLDAITSPDAEEREEMMAILDAAMHDSTAAASHMLTLYDSLNAQHQLALETLERVAAENDLLIGRIASGKGGMLDDITSEGGRLPPKSRAPLTDFDKYRAMRLEPFQVIKDDTPEPASAESGYLKALIGRVL